MITRSCTRLSRIGDRNTHPCAKKNYLPLNCVTFLCIRSQYNSVTNELSSVSVNSPANPDLAFFFFFFFPFTSYDCWGRYRITFVCPSAYCTIKVVQTLKCILYYMTRRYHEEVSRTPNRTKLRLIYIVYYNNVLCSSRSMYVRPCEALKTLEHNKK